MMIKKIRLSERELLNLVNKIIREQDENPDDVPVGYKSGGYDKEIHAKNSFVISVENALRSLKMAEINKYRTPGGVFAYHAPSTLPKGRNVSRQGPRDCHESDGR